MIMTGAIFSLQVLVKTPLISWAWLLIINGNHYGRQGFPGHYPMKNFTSTAIEMNSEQIVKELQRQLVKKDELISLHKDAIKLRDRKIIELENDFVGEIKKQL